MYKPLPFKKSDVIYITNLRYEKVKSLFGRKDLEQILTLPCDIVLDSDKTFRGYTMHYYKGSVNLEKYIHDEKININKVYDLYIEISKYFQFFHEHDIYLPDFSLHNVLLIEDKLMFCDSDGYRVGNLPSTMNSSFMISHYHTKNSKFIENANFDKELLIGFMLKDIFNLNMGMMYEKEFKRKLDNLKKQYEFTEREMEQFKMLKQTNENLLYPHEFMKPVKKKVKKRFWF